MYTRIVKIWLSMAFNCSIGNFTISMMPQIKEVVWISRESHKLAVVWKTGLVPIPHPTLREELVLAKASTDYEFFEGKQI